MVTNLLNFWCQGIPHYILVPSEQIGLSYISKKYYLPFKVAIAEITGTEYEIKFILPEQTKKIRPSLIKQENSRMTRSGSKLESVNPNYTFDTFVVGSNNRFAHVRLSSSSGISGRSIQPSLYLWRTGTWQDPPDAFHRSFHPGTTIRMQKIIYVTSEEFTNEVIESIRKR